jgi:PAS domain-containing protein
MRPAPATRAGRTGYSGRAAHIVPSRGDVELLKTVTTKVQAPSEARRRDRQVVALVGTALLIALAGIAALATEFAPSDHELTSVLAAASVAGAIGVLAWSGVGPRRGLVRDLRDADARYRAMVEQLPAVVYVADIGAQATWHYVSPRIDELLGSPPRSGWPTRTCG